MKSSKFIGETRERDAWLAGQGNGGETLSTSALLRGVAGAIPVSESQEEQARRTAMNAVAEAARSRDQPPLRAPWYTRFGQAMRFVFTLGRRR